MGPAAPYQNGSHERMHLDMKRELQGQIDGDIRYHQKIFDLWKREYNEERPHESLNLKTPASVYLPSGRKYDPEYADFEYPVNFKNRHVNKTAFSFSLLQPLLRAT